MIMNLHDIQFGDHFRRSLWTEYTCQSKRISVEHKFVNKASRCQYGRCDFSFCCMMCILKLLMKIIYCLSEITVQAKLFNSNADSLYFIPAVTRSFMCC